MPKILKCFCFGSTPAIFLLDFFCFGNQTKKSVVSTAVIMIQSLITLLESLRTYHELINVISTCHGQFSLSQSPPKGRVVCVCRGVVCFSRVCFGFFNMHTTLVLCLRRQVRDIHLDFGGGGGEVCDGL